MGLWVRAHATVKNMGSMGDSDAEKGGLLSLTYASPPEWDCPPPPPRGGELATLPQKHYKLCSLAQSLVKRRFNSIFIDGHLWMH